MIGKEVKKVREEGLIKGVLYVLKKKGVKALGYSLLSYVKVKYRKFIFFVVRPLLPTKNVCVNLNGVKVFLKISVAKKLPFYTSPYPIEDNENYEKDEVDAIRKYCNEGDTVIIIGGGLGVSAIHASKKVGRAGKVIVYEQSRDSYRVILDTINENETESSIDVICSAVGHSGDSNFTPDVPGNVKITNPQDIPRANVIEMDCEGAEKEIIKSLKKMPDKILVETHNNHDDVKKILQSKGYNIIEVIKNGPHQVQGCTHIRASLN
ncbi:hypothetical protein GGP50_001638 [Salinibacter ruber]|uniref:hypothetical protein n=1 Tax=Salinibacter ruber TaxID=146919 RepID=UPI002169A14B|nr:hypothetical protein [Salinibacter ruber]MCS4193417.1 hypothetical protein [Salinibacter ruber]